MSSPTGTANLRSKPLDLSIPARRAMLVDLGDFLGTAVLPFALVLYLGLKGGGYDAVVRSEVGIAAWWIVLIGAVAGLVPMKQLSRWSVASLVCLFAFAGWTAAGIGWSESAERSAAEVARVMTLLGVFAVAVSLQRFGSLRRTVGAVAAAITILGFLALGSRLQPSWFPANETAQFLETARSRLNWPLNYWNGLATLLVMGIPLLLAFATSARTVIVRAASAGAVPALALGLFFTLSRGGAVELVVALVLLGAFSANRAGSLPTWGIAAGGSTLLILAALQRDELTDGLVSGAALSQGDEMLVLTVVTCVAVALLVAALHLAHRSGMTPMIPALPRTTRAALAAAVVLAGVGFAVLDGPTRLADGFEEFKSTEQLAGSEVSRFESVNGSNRWQIWGSAVDAAEGSPVLGIGPGTFEFWWAENGSDATFVRDAHSLYLETLGELGVIGFVVLLAFFVAVIGGSLVRLRTTFGGDRKLLAGAVAAMGAFAVAAAIDWAWELTILPVVFLLLAAAALGGDAKPAGDRSPSPISLPLPWKLVTAGVAFLAIGSIVVPLASTQEVRASQEAAGSDRLTEALGRANQAADLQPFAGSPPLQRALVLERLGQLEAAALSAEEATRAEPTNWRTWFVLARVEAAGGDAPAALRSYRRAQELNPRSAILSPSEDR